MNSNQETQRCHACGRHRIKATMIPTDYDQWLCWECYLADCGEQEPEIP